MQITAEVAGADIQMEHAKVKAGPIKHIEQTKIPRSGDPALLIEVEAGQFFFTDMPEGLGEVLAEAFGKWEEARNAPVPPAEPIKLTAKAYAANLKSGGMRCNCDLDNWQPELSTGHSHVCRIHKAAIAWKKNNA